MILINGWEFDFRTMMAYRSLQKLTIHVRGNGTIGRQYKHELRLFFHAPEDRLNDVIDQAYINFLFENQILV